MPDVAVSTEIDAPPDRVWALVSDLPRMGEWSPEATGGRWQGKKGPEVGARFIGTNKKGFRRWATISKVVEAEPGQSFVFEVTAGPGLKVSRWGYRIEPADGGCSVTEEWTDNRSKFFKKLTGAVFGIPDRAEHNRKGMALTLERVKAAAEKG